MYIIKWYNHYIKEARYVDYSMVVGHRGEALVFSTIEEAEAFINYFQITAEVERV
jgi:hypothetical protein